MFDFLVFTSKFRCVVEYSCFGMSDLARTIAPKKPMLVQKAKTIRSLTAGLNRDVEQVLAHRAGAAGKLTIMKPPKK